MIPPRSLVLAAVAVSVALLARPVTAETLVHPEQVIPDNGSVSPMTAAFVAAVGPFVGYLEASDELAVTRATGRIHVFAEREARGRTSVVVELENWAVGIRRERYNEAHAPTIDRLGPVFGLVADPVDIVVVPADLRQRADFLTLQRLEGRDFEARYVASQAGTLRQLANTYVDYIKNGDDQVLRALSVRDLPRVRGLLAALSRL